MVMAFRREDVGLLREVPIAMFNVFSIAVKENQLCWCVNSRIRYDTRL